MIVMYKCRVFLAWCVQMSIKYMFMSKQNVKSKCLSEMYLSDKEKLLSWFLLNSLNVFSYILCIGFITVYVFPFNLINLFIITHSVSFQSFLLCSHLFYILLFFIQYFPLGSLIIYSLVSSEFQQILHCYTWDTPFPSLLQMNEEFELNWKLYGVSKVQDCVYCINTRHTAVTI